MVDNSEIEINPIQLEELLPEMTNKIVSLSVTIIFGNPCSLTMLSKNTLAMETAV
jgi:hypothetical protein